MSSGGFWRSPSIVTTIAAARAGEPGMHRRVLAEVALEAHAARTRDPPAWSRSSVGERPVGRAVVDEDQLERRGPVERGDGRR